MHDVFFDKGGTVVIVAVVESVGVSGRLCENLAGEAPVADRHGHALCLLRK